MNAHTAGTASMLVETVADLMSLYMQTGHLNNLSVFSDVFLSLAKGIDHAVANNEVPLRSHELPSLLKQVYKYRNEFSIQEASMMLLMMYVKSVCKVGWFRNEDVDYLLKLIQEVSRYFSSAEDADINPSYAYPYVSRVLRSCVFHDHMVIFFSHLFHRLIKKWSAIRSDFFGFFPKLHMGRIIVPFKSRQPGFGAFHVDFHIVRGIVAPEKEEILLLVTNVDNMEMSSCMIASPETSFLLNGKQLEGTNKDNMLQFPTIITKMLKYGVNLLQVIGRFDGHYVAVIGIMSLLPFLESPGIKDYSRAPSLACPDLEIVETSSRVSPNWPVCNSWHFE